MNPEPGEPSARDGNLSRDVSGGLDRGVREDLERLRAESLLARQDAVNELTRELDQALTAPLALSEIAGTLERPDSPEIASFSELQDLLAAPEMSGLTDPVVRTVRSATIRSR